MKTPQPTSGPLLHVAFSTDDGYVMPMCVAMASLFESNPGLDLRVHVLTDGLSDDSRAKIDSTCATWGRTWQMHIVDGSDTTMFPDQVSDYLTKAAYYRFFLPAIMGPEVERVLYLDCDIAVTGALDDLTSLPLEGHSAAVVEDLDSGNPRVYERLGYPQSLNYFNSGVMLFNLGYWREHNLTQACLDSYAANPRFDQEVLNIVLAKSKLMLPLRYNVQDGFVKVRPGISAASRPLLREAWRNPAIVHYTGKRKPWLYYSHNPLDSHWFGMLDLTLWKGWRPKGTRLERFKKKIFNPVFEAIGLRSPKWLKPEQL